MLGEATLPRTRKQQAQPRRGGRPLPPVALLAMEGGETLEKRGTQITKTTGDHGDLASASADTGLRVPGALGQHLSRPGTMAEGLEAQPVNGLGETGSVCRPTSPGKRLCPNKEKPRTRRLNAEFHRMLKELMPIL